MFLEARAASCFSSTFVLKLDDRAIGKYEGRWFSESLDLALTGRRRRVGDRDLHLQRPGAAGGADRIGNRDVSAVRIL